MNTERCYSISELNQVLNLTLEESLGSIAFMGELSEVKRAASGHVYCRIQDEESQIDLILWSSTARTVTFDLTQGLAVRCRGRPNVYKKSGKLQIVVQKIELAGEGALRKKFLELKAKLEREGLFAQERKRPLPFLPKAIGIVTSQSGAVVHDIMIRLKERMPQIPVYLVDVRVQGNGAAEEIAAGIRFLDAQGICDVMIVGRGGGSLEDLWAFNEEVVVRAIFAARTPVVSAVGHEVDVSLSDFVADVRAPTPTAAAEMVVPHRTDLLRQLGEYSRRLQEFERWFSPLVQAVDELDEKLKERVRNVFDQLTLRLSTAEAHLKALNPREVLALMGHKVEMLLARMSKVISVDRVRELASQLNLAEARLNAAGLRSLERSKNTLENFAQRFESTSPKRVLERGFSVVTRLNASGASEIVKSAHVLAGKDRVSIRFAEGSSEAEILSSARKGPERDR